MLKKVQKKLQKQAQNNESKEIMIALDECIEEAKKTQIGEFIKVNNSLFEVKVKFKSKHISKLEYIQLLGLEMFVKNSKYSEESLRRAIFSKPINYSFIIKCDRKYNDFLERLKENGALSVVESYIREENLAENLSKNNL